MKKLRLPIFLISILFLFGFLLPKFFPVLAKVEIEENFCSKEVEEGRTSRPTECYVCNQNDLLTPSCATSIKITTGKDYGPLKGGPDFRIEWDGTVSVTPINLDPNDQNLKIPFVGMKGQEDENSYLADYFEGTNEYYRNYGNQTTLTNYQGILRKLTPLEYQNQLKKQLIARVPKEEEIVEENPINDYKVFYTGRFCWDTPFWMDAGRFVFNEILDLTLNSVVNTITHTLKDIFIDRPIAWINKTFKTKIAEIKDKEIRVDLELPDIGHYCLYEDKDSSGTIGYLIVKGINFSHRIKLLGQIQDFLEGASKIPGLVHFSSKKTIEQPLSAITIEHQPPSPNDEQYKDNFPKYREDYLNWKYNEDGSLSEWYLLWQAVPMLSREDTLGKIEPYLNEKNDEDQIDVTSGETSTSSAVPHLARLYEGSKITSDLLTPVWDGEKTIEMVKTPEIPETDPPNICFKESYLPPTGEGDDLCCGPVKIKFKAVDEFTDLGYYEAKCNQYSTLTKDEKAICDDTYTQTVSRNIGINLKHPYLDEIWSYTTNANGGFFNIFRPQEYANFEDTDAAQAISYSGSFESKDIVPNQGLFFFPHLGGVQKAKEWVVNQALWPYVE